jgi:hypothetical protein
LACTWSSQRSLRRAMERSEAGIAE